MAQYVFGIVGSSGTGKTSVLERLLAELARRGHRVGGLRQVDQGLVLSIPGSPDRPLLRASTALYTEHLDLLLVEGFPQAAWPKLEVHPGTGSLEAVKDPWVIAAVGPRQPRQCPVPWFHWDEISQVAGVVEHMRTLGIAQGSGHEDAAYWRS